MAGELLKAQLPPDTRYSDYAAISFRGNAVAQTISHQDVPQLITDFDTNGPAVISTPDQANNRALFGATGVYDVKVDACCNVVGAGQDIHLCAFGISQTTIGITSITNANPGVVETDSAHGLSPGDLVKITNSTTMTEPNDQVWTVGTVADSTHFELHDWQDANVNTGAWGAHDAGSGEIAMAMETDSHADQSMSNGVLENIYCCYPFSATEGDAVEAYLINHTSANNITHEHGSLVITKK